MSDVDDVGETSGLNAGNYGFASPTSEYFDDDRINLVAIAHTIDGLINTFKDTREISQSIQIVV